MTRDLFTNQGSTTVPTGGTTAPAQGTSQGWTVTSSASFPAASNAASPPTQFYVADVAAPTELMLVTNVSGTSWTVTRGADGTTPVTHTAGFTVRNVVPATILQELTDRDVLSGTYNVRKYGALGDGSTDDTAAFTACMNAAGTYATSNVSAVMVVPPGNYKITDTVTVKAGVKVRAYGSYIFAGGTWTTGHQMFNGSGSGTFTGGPHGFEWHGGTLDAKGQLWATGTDFDIIRVGNCRGVVFENVTFRNVPSWHCLDFEAVDGAVVDGCRFEGFKDNSTGAVRGFSEAVQIDMDDADFTASQNFLMANCYVGAAIDGSGLGSWGTGVGSHTGNTGTTYSNIVISNNVIDDPVDSGIHIACWFDSTISDNVITGGVYGIKSQPAVFAVNQTSQRVTITGNTIKQCTNAGMYLNGDPSREQYHYTISNNVVVSTNSQSQAAINCDQMYESVISGNTVKMGTSSTGDGIYLRNSADTEVIGNNISGAASGGGYGISVLGCTRCYFSNNRLRRINKSGIRMESGTVSTQCQIANNFITGAGAVTTATYWGIELTNAAHDATTLVNNRIELNGSGNEMLAPYSIGASTTNTIVREPVLVARATSTTTVATSITALNGLTLTVPAGTWRMKAWVPAVIVGSPTAMTYTVSPSGGPTTSSIYIDGIIKRTGTSPGSASVTAFNSASASMGALTAVDAVFEVDGTFVSSTSGTISLSMTRTGGTSFTPQIGSYLMCERIG